MASPEGMQPSVGPFHTVQPFSQKSRTPRVAKEFQIGLYDPAEADLELLCNSWSAGVLGERQYGACPKNDTCAFSEGLTLHCTGAGGVGYEKILDWPPWKEPLPTRAWLTTP